MRLRDDRGVGTLLGMVLALVLMGAGMIVAGVVSATVAHQRAAVAADLAALAAASRDCDHGERVARAQGAVLFACERDGAEAVVTVGIPAPPLLDRLARWSGQESPALASTSRAGPGTQ